jgi:hypothetical protein
MAKDRKQSTIDALNRYYQKQLIADKPKESRAHYGKPEKSVERDCLSFMRGRGWSINIFEAKATWSPSQGAWTQQGMKAGVCDCMGNIVSEGHDDGVAVAVEFKAPGAMSSFNSDKRYLQRKFIVDKINSGAFACVVDSAALLEKIYSRWHEIRATDKSGARQFLISSLPQTRTKTRLEDAPLFDDE